MSAENRAYTIRNILTQTAKYVVKTASLRGPCVLRAQILAAAKNLFRRPRIIHGLYLGKEPLEYQKSSTHYDFRFSFQKADEEMDAN